MNNQLNIKSLIYTACLLLLLPNFIFVLVTYWTGDNRAIFNIDYLLPFLCFTIHNRFIKALGTILFIIAFIIDLLLIVLQHFPSLHFRDSYYLISFIFSGPRIFLVYAIAIVTLLFLELIVLLKFAKKSTISNIFIIVLLLITTNIAYYFIERDNSLENIKPYHTSLLNSNITYYIQNQEVNFMKLMGEDLLYASPYQYATSPWIKAIEDEKELNDKLFLIINESWGSPLNKVIQDDILKTLKSKMNYFEYFEQGEFFFRGFTVEGELRELCQVYPSTLDLYKIKTGFQNCLPHKLNQLGYKTIVTQGWLGNYYGAKHWYPKAGFSERIFQDDLQIASNCIPFNSICDWDMLPIFKRNFANNNKIFNYWLTTTPHYSYYEHDIHNTRFNCSRYDIPEKSDVCHSFMLQAQFFDDMADFISSPEMQGVEVIIVGDHPPPLFKAEEIALYKTKEMEDGKVGWVHFKIKEMKSQQNTK